MFSLFLGGGTLKKLLYIITLVILISQIGYSQDAAANDGNGTGDVNESQLLFDDPAADSPETIQDGSLDTLTVWDLVRMVAVLAGVIGLIYLVFFFLRKTTGIQMVENNLIQLVSSKNLQPNKTLHVIEVGNQYFVIACSDQSMNLISEITDKETIDDIRLNYKNPQGTAEAKPFWEVLTSMFSKPNAEPDGEKGKEPLTFRMTESADLIKERRERLKHLGDE